MIFDKKLSIVFFFASIFILAGCENRKKLDLKKKLEAWKNSQFDWRNPNFYEVKAYYYQTYKSSLTGKIVKKKTGSGIIKNGRLNRAIWKKSATKLNTSQIQKVSKIAQNLIKNCFSEPEFCYDPHHGIVFYDSLGFAKASISICFECSIAEYYPSNKFDGQCIESYEEIFKELNIDIPKSLNEINDYGERLYRNK